MAEFTYDLPNGKTFLNKLRATLLAYKKIEIASLLRGAECEIFSTGAFGQRWNARDAKLRIRVPVERLEKFTDWIKAEILNLAEQLIESNLGYDFSEIQIIPIIDETALEDETPIPTSPSTDTKTTRPKVSSETRGGPVETRRSLGAASMSPIETIIHLIAEGETLVPKGGTQGYNSHLQSDYVSWRAQAISIVRELGPSVAQILDELASDTEGKYFYKTSADRVLGTLKAALIIAQRSSQLASATATNPPTPPPQEIHMDIKIFISHSFADSALAKQLIEFLKASLIIPEKSIRCTSVPGYKLEVGDDVVQTLRENLKAARVVLGLLTETSIKSGFVLAELGAAWGLGKPTLPLLGPKFEFDDLPDILKGKHAIKLDDRPSLAGLIEVVGKRASLEPRSDGTIIAAAKEDLVQLVASNP